MFALSSQSMKSQHVTIQLKAIEHSSMLYPLFITLYRVVRKLEFKTLV